MRGSIRAFTGILTLMFVAGGLDNATDAQLPMLIAIAVVAGLVAFSGANAMKENV